MLERSGLSCNYPEDVKYNLCQIGDNVIHNFKYTDLKVLEYIDNQKLTKIQVNQGYTKCSICPTSSNSCITSDKGIYKALISNKIDALLLRDETINLNDKNELKSKMNGFIGGATAVIDDIFIIFGDIEKLHSKNELLEHLRKYKLKLHYFTGLDIVDYGGVVGFVI